MATHQRRFAQPTFLITAGPTREYLDPVRFLSNASSGAMGYALARAAAAAGSPVILVSGPVNLEPPRGVTLVPVTSAREMFAAVKKSFPRADIVIGAAAVADYRPLRRAQEKIKRAGAQRSAVALVQNPDIIGWCGARKQGRVVAGFALETAALLARARGKLARKRLDLIVANGPAAINTDRATAWLMPAGGKTRRMASATKKQIAEAIIHETLAIRQARQAGHGVR